MAVKIKSKKIVKKKRVKRLVDKAKWDNSLLASISNHISWARADDDVSLFSDGLEVKMDPSLDKEQMNYDLFDIQTFVGLLKKHIVEEEINKQKYDLMCFPKNCYKWQKIVSKYKNSNIVIKD